MSTVKVRLFIHSEEWRLNLRQLHPDIITTNTLKSNHRKLCFKVTNEIQAYNLQSGKTNIIHVCVLLTLLLVADVNTTLHIVALQRLALLPQH